MLYLILYVIGYLVSYYLGRKFFRSITEYYSWGFVIILAFLSLFSWITVGALLFMLIIRLLINKFSPKPPKWL